MIDMCGSVHCLSVLAHNIVLYKYVRVYLKTYVFAILTQDNFVKIN